MKKVIFVTAILLVALLLTACAQPTPTPTITPEPVPVEPPQNVGNFEFVPENYPRMGGSLAALPLGEAVTATVLGISREEAGSYISFTGSTTSNYRALIYGEFDILLAYEPSQDAIAMAEENNFEWEMMPIGRDALVFINNINNPVKDISSEEIRSIYSGQITNRLCVYIIVTPYDTMTATKNISTSGST